MKHLFYQFFIKYIAKTALAKLITVMTSSLLFLVNTSTLTRLPHEIGRYKSYKIALRPDSMPINIAPFIGFKGTILELHPRALTPVSQNQQGILDDHAHLNWYVIDISATADETDF